MRDISMIDKFAAETDQNNFQILFTIKSSYLFRNSRGKIVDKGSTWDKIRYIVLCIFSFGSYSVGHLYKKSCKQLEKVCILPNSTERVTVKRTCEIFQKIFPNYEKLQQAAKNLKEAKTKKETSSAKQEVKKTIDTLLTNGYYGNSSSVKKLKEINLHPRLAEAKFAIEQGVKSEKLDGQHLAEVYKVYDRSGPDDGKCLAIFKLCKKNSGDAKNELLVWSKLKEPNKINVKKTLYRTLKMNGKSEQGILQKFIKGNTLFNSTEERSNIHIDNLSDEAVDEMHRVAIFDLINLNEDRHANNLMIDTKGHLWAIDHGYLLSGSPYSKAFVKYWPELTNQPFSENVEKYINSLDVNIHCGSSLSKKQRQLVEKLIGFLKFCVADERKVKLNIYQIYEILSTILRRTSDIPDDFQSCIEEGLRFLLTDNNYDNNYFKLLFTLFPEAEKSMYHRKGLNDKLIFQIDINDILKRIQDLGAIEGLGPELCLEYLLKHEKELIDSERSGKKFTKDELKNKDWIFKHVGFREFIESIAKGTKYYDSEKKTCTQELLAFIDRWEEK